MLCLDTALEETLLCGLSAVCVAGRRIHGNPFFLAESTVAGDIPSSRFEPGCSVQRGGRGVEDKKEISLQGVPTKR